jgi:hypothetical protein
MCIVERIYPRPTFSTTEKLALYPFACYPKFFNMAHPYIVDNVSDTIAEIRNKLWFDSPSDLDDHVLSIFGNPQLPEDIVTPQVNVPEPTNPDTLDGICQTCNTNICCEIPLDTHGNMQNHDKSQHPETSHEFAEDGSESPIFDDIWQQGSGYVKADQVMIRLSSLLSDGPLEYVPCYMTTGFRINHRMIGDLAKYIAISYVASEGWLANGLSRQLKHRIYRIGMRMGADYVWIDELCLPPSDRTKYLETMGEVYRHAIAICVISRDVINSGNYRHLFLSIWMTRAWTFQEGYNARRLVILESLTRDKYVVMTKENMPVEHKRTILCGNSVKASLSISTILSRGIGNPQDVPYVIASLMDGKHTKMLIQFNAFYIMYLTIYTMMMITYGIIRFACIFGKCNGISKFPAYQLFLFTVAYTFVFIVVLFNRSLVFSGFRWRNIDGFLDNSDAVDWNILLLSPELEHGPTRCWKPDIVGQNPIDIATCMDLTGNTYRNITKDFVRICPKILTPISHMGIIGKIMLGIVACFYYILRKKGLRCEGRLLTETQTREFIQMLGHLQYSWIQDVMAADETHEDHRILLMLSLDDRNLDCMIFGFVMLDENNILHRRHRFWILPVTHETARRCKEVGRNYYIGRKYPRNRF